MYNLRFVKPVGVKFKISFLKKYLSYRMIEIILIFIRKW